MRFPDRVTLLIKSNGGGGPNDAPGETVLAKDTPCLISPVVNTNVLMTYGLANKQAFEVHLPAMVDGVNRVEIDGRKYEVAKVFGRRRTVLIVSV